MPSIANFFRVVWISFLILPNYFPLDVLSASCSQSLTRVLQHAPIKIIEPLPGQTTKIDPIKRELWINSHPEGPMRDLARAIADGIELPEWSVFKSELFELARPFFEDQGSLSKT